MSIKKFNRRKKQVSEILDEKCDGIDPIVEMVNLAKSKDTTKRLKFDIYKTIAEYMYPKRKAVQHTGDDSQPVRFAFDLSADEGDEKGQE